MRVGSTDPFRRSPSLISQTVLRDRHGGPVAGT